MTIVPAVADGTGDVIDAEASVTRLRAKADRFFRNDEWLNASASYLLLLDRSPRDVDLYGHAIVCGVMARDTIGAMELIQESMQNDVPFDSVLASVSRISMLAGSSDLYEKILYECRSRFPWMSRNIDLQLLRYYHFRNNGPEIIRYARIMLAGMPDDIGFRHMLADGYMLDGQTGAAAAVWHRILAENPEDYDALLSLGNLYVNTGRVDEGLPLLSRAYAIRPTPYVRQLIDSTK